jgi:hypothetical protein
MNRHPPGIRVCGTTKVTGHPSKTRTVYRRGVGNGDTWIHLDKAIVTGDLKGTVQTAKKILCDSEVNGSGRVKSRIAD